MWRAAGRCWNPRLDVDDLACDPAITDGRESAAPGIIRPVSDPLLRDTWPEALYLAYKHSTLNYTTETASAQPMAQRIATQCAVIRAAIENFL